MSKEEAGGTTEIHRETVVSAHAEHCGMPEAKILGILELLDELRAETELLLVIMADITSHFAFLSSAARF